MSIRWSDIYILPARNYSLCNGKSILSKNLKMSVHQKYEKQIKKAKSRLNPSNNWSSLEYAHLDFETTNQDLKPMSVVSTKTFKKEYLRQNRPCLIDNMFECKGLDSDSLVHCFSHEKFKVGTDNMSNAVKLSLKSFLYYCNTEAKIDDSPMYIFDSTIFKSTAVCNNGITVGRTLAETYKVPPVFKPDLFELGGERRPPFRWIVIGPARSGTGMHVDPLGTSAWNALVQGRKRWCLFPPNTPTHIINPQEKSFNDEGISWFATVYPLISQPNLRKALGMIEFVQSSNQIVFVPSGWHHVVINLEFTVAITHNFCSYYNFNNAWLRTRFSRPMLAKKVRRKLAGTDLLNLKRRQRLEKMMKEYETCPGVDSSQGSSSSESDDES